MICPKCEIKNKKDASFCSKCGEKLDQKEIEQEPKKEDSKHGNNKSYKKIIPIVLVILVLAVGAYTLINIFGPDSDNTTSNKQQKSQPTKTIEPPPTEMDQLDVQANGDTLIYAKTPFIQGSTELSRKLTEGDGVRASYQTPEGVTGKEVIDFFSSELAAQGWQITKQDEDSLVEALSIDEVQLRVWIYFDGSDGSGVIYNIDFRIPGSEAWLPLPNQ